MPHDVFIGYSRRDSEAAVAIQTCLTDAGVSCFLDTSSIPDSAEWTAVIAKAIEECHVFLAILSRNSLEHRNYRRYVGKELAYAAQHDKPCVPVLLERDLELPGAILFQLICTQFIYAEPALPAVLDRIAAVTAQRVDQEKHEKEWADRDDVLARANYNHRVDCSVDGLGLVNYNVPEGSGAIEGSAYVLSSAPDHYVGRHLDRVPVTSEFVLEVKLRRLAGPPEEWFGLEFGQSFPGNYYQFLLNGDGVVHVSKHFGEVWTPLLDRAGLRYVHCEGQQNQLMVVRHDRLLHLFVNERHVVTLEDFDIRSGTPGLMIGRGIRVEFSDLQAAGISLESVFNEALSHWRELEIKKAKQVLDYVARYDPSFSAGGWPNASQLIREVQPDRGETVLIAIGQTMLPQLNDRGPAERLRDAINRKGRGLPFRWATIVTDSALLRDEVYCRCPIISVGGPLVNQFTERLGHSQRENPRSSAGVHIQCSTIPGERHVALWGDRPNETAVAVDTYMSSELLDGYLASIWGT